MVGFDIQTNNKDGDRTPARSSWRVLSMRKWFASLCALGLAATAATAQTIPSAIANSLFQLAEDDGIAEVTLKFTSPTAAGEMYNVDFNTDGAGMTVFGIAVELSV